MKVFIWLLIGYHTESAERALLKVRTGGRERERERERAVKGRIIVALRPVSLGSFAVKKKRTC